MLVKLPYYVYILKSKSDGSFYIGHTSNLQERIRRHNCGYCTSTKHHRPFELVYKQEFLTRSEAIRKERYLKSQKNTNYLVKQIKNKASVGR